ncbi:hypothetical protein PYW08_011973 [Mythimna loreyi]|uniref:Uncharacterized protein n=1 Tax=Mythimna loreyi TaxID=667449 RepID=A0ACC2QLX7_9NEOP|nr:hypothetical protein PYW08_011973 [Mythimna loreyi]
MAKTLIWLLVHSLLLGGIAPQRLDLSNTNSSRMCEGKLIRNIIDLKKLDGCVVILGSLEIFIEKVRKENFVNMTFWDLREITEYLVIYRVRELESVGQLFPSLTRIRGLKLLNNFALVVYDNSHLREIGLYSLLKIDRGGVSMWQLPQACFVDTIDWKVLAPKARHVISPPDIQVQCSIPCSCSRNASLNRCWNNRKCQLFLDGPEADKCNEQCIGCRKTNKNICFVCRHFTYNGTCVTQCPPNTILIPDNQYCVTEQECFDIDRWVFNNTCVADCPIDYKVNNKTHPITCEPCTHCDITCGDLKIQSLGSIQNAERCVYVNGSLVIHVRAIAGAMGDLRAYLGHIQEVSQYIAVEGSDITSLDFLSSLRIIKGEKLKDDKYVLDVNHNTNLQTLFTSAVAKNLIIKNGTARFEQNPVLCMSKIDELQGRLPVQPTLIEVPIGSNGYSGACKEVSFDFKIAPSNESSVLIKFSPVRDHNIHYSALYVRLPPGVQTAVVPETCSEFEWHATDVPAEFDKGFGVAKLNSLQPASTYALCIEIYDPKNRRLIRSNIFNFSTPVGIPEPPFIVELVASASDVVVIRWVDHKDYMPHIDYYELDVALIERSSVKSAVDYCKLKEDVYEVDYTRHALVRRPPPEYNRGCESMCGILASVTPGAMVEEYFDVCDDTHIDCGNQESIISNNSTFGNYVRTLILLNISSPRNDFQVGGLAPFSDYKFRLRACSGGHCSRSSKGVVRTFSLKNADIPSITNLYANQFGHIYVKWNPPNVTNGPILSYSVEVLPRININNLMPQSWCISANETMMFIQSVIVPKYLVRVCVKTLASSKSCSDWIKITSATQSKTVLLWAGVTCGFLIYIASCLVGWFKRRSSYRVDVVPLVDSSSSSCVESEPPALMLSDFVPFHTISLD